MTTLGALSQARTNAEASLPLGRQLTGLMRFGGEWVAFSEGPGETDHLEASGTCAYVALKRLSTACGSGEGRRRRRLPGSGGNEMLVERWTVRGPNATPKFRRARRSGVGSPQSAAALVDDGSDRCRH